MIRSEIKIFSFLAYSLNSNGMSMILNSLLLKLFPKFLNSVCFVVCLIQLPITSDNHYTADMRMCIYTIVISKST